MLAQKYVQGKTQDDGVCAASQEILVAICILNLSARRVFQAANSHYDHAESGWGVSGQLGNN